MSDHDVPKRDFPARRTLPPPGGEPAAHAAAGTPPEAEQGQAAAEAGPFPGHLLCHDGGMRPAGQRLCRRAGRKSPGTGPAPDRPNSTHYGGGAHHQRPGGPGGVEPDPGQPLEPPAGKLLVYEKRAVQWACRGRAVLSGPAGHDGRLPGRRQFAGNLLLLPVLREAAVPVSEQGQPPGGPGVFPGEGQRGSRKGGGPAGDQRAPAGSGGGHRGHS